MTQVERVRVGDVLRLERRQVIVDVAAEYDEIGVRSFGKGIFHKEPVDGAILGDKRVFRIQPGDLVISNVFAWEGAIALASPAEAGRIGSHRFMTFVPRGERIDTAWAAWYFQSEPGLELIRKASPGSAGRNKTLAIKRFEDLVIPLPPVAEQRRTAARLDRVRDAVAAINDRVSAALSHATPLLESWLGQQIPADGAMVTLAEAAAVVRGRGPRYEPGSGTLAVNQGCVQWDGIQLHRAREVDASWWAGVPVSGRVALGDVLVNSTGEGTIGRAAIATDDVVGLPFDSHVMVVRTDASVLLPEYLTLYLRSPQGQDQIIAAKGANTTKQTELGKAKLERFVIPAPSLAAQKGLVTSFRNLSGRRSDLNMLDAARGERLAAIMPAAMNQEFVGLT
ncbi:MAG: hypothetical protein U0R70_13755 [Solirubrobacteraceae bacterium]